MLATSILLLALAQPAPPLPPELVPEPPPSSTLEPVPARREVPARALLAASGMALASDLVCGAVTAYGLDHLKFNFGSSNDEGDDPRGLFIFVGAAGCLFGTPLATVAGARWAGLDGDGARAYWTTFVARLAWLAAAGVLQAKFIGRDGNPVLIALPFAVGELLFQPWVATRVLAATGPRQAEVPPRPSPADQALPVRDPAGAGSGWP